MDGQYPLAPASCVAVHKASRFPALSVAFPLFVAAAEDHSGAVQLAGILVVAGRIVTLAADVGRLLAWPTVTDTSSARK